jgi:hypothetical protein
MPGMKTIRAESGDTTIRPSGLWADRAAPLIFGCAAIAWGASLWSSLDDMPVARLAESERGLWLTFAGWLLALLSAGGAAAWSFFGTTKISVSADDLIVRHYLGKEVVFVSQALMLSKIKDVRVDERTLVFRGHTSCRWVVVVETTTGDMHEVAKFASRFDADEFLRRHVSESQS